MSTSVFQLVKILFWFRISHNLTKLVDCFVVHVGRRIVADVTRTIELQNLVKLSHYYSNTGLHILMVLGSLVQV